MKTITLILTAIALLSIISCGTSSISDVAYFEFNGADYWVNQYNSSEVDLEAIKSHTKSMSNPQKTVYHFYYDESINVDIYKEQRFTYPELAATLVENPPKHSFYVMQNYDEVFEDPMALMKDEVNQ